MGRGALFIYILTLANIFGRTPAMATLTSSLVYRALRKALSEHMKDSFGPAAWPRECTVNCEASDVVYQKQARAPEGTGIGALPLLGTGPNGWRALREFRGAPWKKKTKKNARRR